MPSERTEVTEIITGLAMLGAPSVEDALDERPVELVNVDDEVWTRLVEHRSAGRFADEFDRAWRNGSNFLRAQRGLRSRRPVRIEWKGPQRPPDYERLPADLRIDHVYLISCKYLSRILSNSAPAVLFDRALVDRRVPRGLDWYAEVAPAEYATLYGAVRRELSHLALPERVDELTGADRAVLRQELRGAWPDALKPAYQALAERVSRESARRWRRRLRTPAAREEMLWRLLRLHGSPYFVLGSTSSAAITVQVMTPWDWRQAFELVDVEIEGDGVGQPRVAWRALVKVRQSGCLRPLDGHVEIRWSHGRFNKVPEAKVYLDTPHHDVCGYESLTGC